MKIALVIYLIIGVLLNLIGPAARLVKKTIQDVKDSSRLYIIYEPPPVSKRKIIALEITLRFLLLCFSPFAYIVLFIDYCHELKKKRAYKTQKKIENAQKLKEIIDNKSYLYFKNTFGGGMICCHGCGYKEEINCSTHGFGEPTEFYDGYQCQSCGKFHTVTTYGNESIDPEKCDCGGELSRKNPIFCPKCKAADVWYQIKYMT